MKSSFWKRAFGSIRAQTSDEDLFAEEALRVVRDHHARDFPNPIREGCAPYQARLSEFRNGAMPSPDERAHILTCSDCYADYQIALAAYRASAKASEKDGSRLLRLPIAVPAAAAAIVLLIAVIAIYNSRHREESGLQTYVNSTPQASPLPSPSAPTSIKPGNNEPKPERPATESLVAVHRVTIDFENARALRRRAPEQSPIIELKPVQQVLLIKLPEGSPRGPYKITLNDPFGKPVRSKAAGSNDGKSVKAHFNLVGLHPGRYSICVTRAQEVPSCLPVTVGPK